MVAATYIFIYVYMWLRAVVPQATNSRTRCLNVISQCYQKKRRVDVCVMFHVVSAREHARPRCASYTRGVLCTDYDARSRGCDIS